VFGEAISQNVHKEDKGVLSTSMNSKRVITRVLGCNMEKTAVDCYN
jgi:hypothetical protein